MLWHPIGEFIIARDILKTCAFTHHLVLGHMSFIDNSRSLLALGHTFFAGISLFLRSIASIMALLAIIAAPAPAFRGAAQLFMAGGCQMVGFNVRPLVFYINFGG